MRYLLFLLLPFAGSAQLPAKGTYFFVSACDTVVLYNYDYITTCDCFALGSTYFLFDKGNKLNMEKLKKDFGIELPDHTGRNQLYWNIKGLYLTVWFETRTYDTLETVRVVWRYDCTDNRLKIQATNSKHYRI